MQTDRGHQLQIEAAQIHKFCAYQGNRVTPLILRVTVRWYDP